MNKIIVISGLPRSGTTMMMNLMNSGGLSVIFDNYRPPDNINEKDNNWLININEKAIKIHSYLLKLLPRDCNYDIIFMNRSLIEISHSVKKLQFESDLLKNNTIFKSIQNYRDHLQEVNSWINDQPNIQKLDVNYNNLMENPDPILQNIKEFLNKDLDLEKMKSVINPKLYINRISDISKTTYSLYRNNIKINVQI